MAMLNSDEHIAVIVGCIVGALMIITVIAVCCYCHCRSAKRKTSSKKSGSSFTNGSHLTRPIPLKMDTACGSKLPPLHCGNHHNINQASLPKVGSSGLWLTHTSILGPTTSHAFARHPDHSSLLRARSEPRLAGAPQGMYESNMKVYQSQQMPPLFELYEPWKNAQSRNRPDHMNGPINRQIMHDPYISEPLPENSAYTESNHSTHIPNGDSGKFNGSVQVHHTQSYVPYNNGNHWLNHVQHDKGANDAINYKDNFIIRDARSPSYSNQLDQTYIQPLLYSKPYWKRDAVNATPINKLKSNHPRKEQSKFNDVPRTSAVPQFSCVNVALNTSAPHLSAFNKNDLHKKEEQQGNGTTVSSGYNTARSDLVREIRGVQNTKDYGYTAAIEGRSLTASDFDNNNGSTCDILPELQQSSSDHTDIEAKHVTTTAFQFLDNYLSDDNSVVGSDQALTKTGDKCETYVYANNVVL